MRTHPFNMYPPPGVTCGKCSASWLKKGCPRCAATGMDPIPLAEVIGGMRMGNKRKLITLRPRR